MLSAAALALASVSGTASAGLTEYTGACTGFEACDDSAFVAAAGGALDMFLSFSTDKFGNPTPNGSADGASFSDDVTFSTMASAFGGSDSALVNSAGSGSGSEIGPFGTWDGTLVIAFANAVSAVGFGTVDFDAGGSISIFDGDTLLDTFTTSGLIFEYFGVVADGGTTITRIELDSSFFAIQDIQFDFAGSAVPEPAALALFGLGIVGLGMARRRTR